MILLAVCFTLCAGAAENTTSQYKIRYSRYVQSVDMDEKTTNITLQVKNTTAKSLSCTFYTKIVNANGSTDSLVAHKKTVKSGNSQITLSHPFQKSGKGKQLVIYCRDANKKSIAAVNKYDLTFKQTVEKITLNKTDLTLILSNKQTQKLTYSYSPKSITDPGVTFKSSNTAVATVSAKGTVTPKKSGTATITVMTKDKTAVAKCSVRVISQPVKLKLSHTSLSLSPYKGISKRITPTVTPNDAPKKTVTYKTSNPKVATVSSKGLVKGVGEGTATITVKTTDGRASATCKVTVSNLHQSLKLNKSTIKMWDYGMYTLKPTVKGVKNPKIKWTSSDNTIATVSDRGIVFGVFKGTATITASVGQMKATCKVQVYREYDFTGTIPAYFESSDNPGRISGSGNDKSYGCFQLHAGSNGPKSFYRFLINNNFNVAIGETLKSAYIKDKYTYGKNFDAAWKKLAKEQREEFRSSQMAYGMSIYYEPLVNRLVSELNFYPDNYGLALKSAIWSRSIQHGKDGAFNRIKTAFESIGGFKGKTEKQLITAIYKECGKVVTKPPYKNSVPMNSDSSIAKEYNLVGKYLKYYSTNSSSVQAGVWKRLNVTELNMLYDLIENPPIVITK
jgi:uncharacterized protein YjdB